MTPETSTGRIERDGVSVEPLAWTVECATFSYRRLPIPEDEQFRALALGLRQTFALIEEYVGDLNRAGDFRCYITVTRDELAVIWSNFLIWRSNTSHRPPHRSITNRLSWSALGEAIVSTKLIMVGPDSLASFQVWQKLLLPV
jgi:hypothetical protein